MNTESPVTTTPYDSEQDTLKHIHRVRDLLGWAGDNLWKRGNDHDRTKLGPMEKPIFDKVTPKLKGLTYGSPEYKESLDELGLALAHHYKNNSHHPEHYPNGINGMSLFDLVEMLCDWKAATERHSNGSIRDSLYFNQDRFDITPQLQGVLENTARELGWV